MRRVSSQKKITIIVIAVFFSLNLCGCMKREVKNIDAKGAAVICFGDSITFGYGVNPGEDYPSALSRMLNMPVINAGIDGDTSIEAIKRFDSDVLERNPLLVIIEFGGNDFLRKTPKEATINNIKEMVERAQAKGAMVAIVDISAGMLFAEYRAAFNRIAKEKRTIFIPHILSGIVTDPHMKSDFLHPNAQGYKIIAQRIYRAIEPHLKRNSELNNIQ